MRPKLEGSLDTDTIPTVSEEPSKPLGTDENNITSSPRSAISRDCWASSSSASRINLSAWERSAR